MQKNIYNITRRNFLKFSLSSSLLFSFPTLAKNLKLNNPIKIGMIADLHQDVVHDGEKRMAVFLKAMEEFNPDVIIQLGDFAVPRQSNKEVITMFNKAHQNSLHVIGNHDMDYGHTRKQCVDLWEMSNRYYVKTVNGIHLIVLDANDKGSPTHKGGYAQYIGKKQVYWLKCQLEKLQGLIIIFSHQALAGPSEIDNAKDIQDILAKYKQKILLAINGHNHIDHVLKIKGVNYYHLNSASYLWLGGKYRTISYSKEIHQNYKYLEYVASYRDSIFATLTVDPKKSEIHIGGTESKWVGKSPSRRGFSKPRLIDGVHLTPKISNRLIEKV